MIHHLQVERYFRMLLLEIRDPPTPGKSSARAWLQAIRTGPPSAGRANLRRAISSARPPRSGLRAIANETSLPAVVSLTPARARRSNKGVPTFGFEILNAAVHGRMVSSSGAPRPFGSSPCGRPRRPWVSNFQMPHFPVRAFFCTAPVKRIAAYRVHSNS